jgi:hypothetical protein
MSARSYAGRCLSGWQYYTRRDVWWLDREKLARGYLIGRCVDLRLFMTSLHLFGPKLAILP